MSVQMPRLVMEIAYEEAAREYLRRLPLEHFMESTPQATQREITLASLAIVKAERPDVHVYNELLVQYRLPRRKKLGQVVPDNMVVLHAGRIKARGSYDVPLQPAGPFLAIEYVSSSNARKDYVENRAKYEHELEVPYYLLFAPESQTLTLYRHTGTRYLRVRANAHGRHEIAELELEVGLHDGWMRYWFRGKLVPLPAELQSDLTKARQALAEESQASAEKTQVLAEKTQALAEKTQALAEERQALAEERQALAEERRARIAAEEETARLRAEVDSLRKSRTKRAGPNGVGEPGA